jgi:uncharacterized protein (TIGR00297 family)
MEWSVQTVVIGLGGSLLIAGAAYWKHSLSLSGFLAAVVLGTIYYTFGSLPWFGTLIAFFISSSALSKWKTHVKKKVEELHEKGGRRDAVQVLANGGLGGLLCIANAFMPHPAWLAAYVGAVAAATADTWATEIGGLSKSKPRSILGGKPVTPGTSGGVTPAGLMASAAGGLFIGLTFWTLSHFSPGSAEIGAALPGLSSGIVIASIALIGGMAGSLGDSVIGAKWQAVYRCSTCGLEMERRVHCGGATRRIRGTIFVNNDAVNVAGSLIGSIAAFGIFTLLQIA